MNTERRMTPTGNITVETRTDGTKAITGYAAVFHRAEEAGTEYRLGKDLVERISPTAFSRAISEKHDARALFNHDPNMLLGRAGAGTLRLSADQRGLKYEIDLPDTQVGRDVAASIARGDLTGSSFAFQVTKQSFAKADKHDVRNIEDVNLLDVGPVTYPAYQATTTGLRSGECSDAFEAREAWTKNVEAEAVAVRSRVISLDIEKALA
jgi:HK97 family phage prohead protease